MKKIRSLAVILLLCGLRPFASFGQESGGLIEPTPEPKSFIANCTYELEDSNYLVNFVPTSSSQLLGINVVFREHDDVVISAPVFNPREKPHPILPRTIRVRRDVLSNTFMQFYFLNQDGVLDVKTMPVLDLVGEVASDNNARRYCVSFN